MLGRKMIGKVFMILVHSVLRTFVSCLYLYEGRSVIIQVLLGKSSSLECYLDLSLAKASPTL